MSPARDAEIERVFVPYLLSGTRWGTGWSSAALARLSGCPRAWVPCYARHAQRGRTPSLVNARHSQTVPGRPKVWNDARWLQKLHALGVLQGALRPDIAMSVVRTFSRP